MNILKIEIKIFLNLEHLWYKLMINIFNNYNNNLILMEKINFLLEINLILMENV